MNALITPPALATPDELTTWIVEQRPPAAELQPALAAYARDAAYHERQRAERLRLCLTDALEHGVTETWCQAARAIVDL
jgi:hypothetical protein